MRIHRRNVLTAAAAGIGALVLFGTSALAATTISIRGSQVPVQASAFEEHDDCDFAGAPSSSTSMWGWHFVLPGGDATFVTLTATFETAGEVTLPGPDGMFVQDGKGAVIYTATDDTLTGAVATIEGTTTQGDFVLSHTCLPVTSPTPSASVTPSASETPSASVTPSVSASASETASATPSVEVSGTVLTTAPSESVSPTVLGVKQTRNTGTLPTTGRAPIVLLMAGVLLVAGGTLLLARHGGRHAR